MHNGQCRQSVRAFRANLHPYMAVNIFKLTAAVSPVRTNRLLLSALRYVPFWLAIQAVWQAKTSHSAPQNGLFRGAEWHIVKSGMAEGDF